ncbi:hypothetical protein [Knoellia subterranea]|uniref:Uncharacterized protein n=1 Tax=Knoellia subterranea KCTC 19937 TaxID=1385521 RepID=A0A0A0JVC0_9MICO|nr:hypothetical protein [Knoellia subterranea]KGN39571.1 hypothetical protein N803_01250 [Knoellia subterranea KCTC 19937]
MSARLLQVLRGHEILAAVGVAAALGLILMAFPVADRAMLLVGAASLLFAVLVLLTWLVRDHRAIEWTTSSGAAPRPRGQDRRITALARTIDTALTGDGQARASVRATLRSLAEASLATRGLAVDPADPDVTRVLGTELTAYLTAAQPHNPTADELTSFVTTLEEI